MTSREISAKSPRMYIQNMMHDWDMRDSVDLVSIKGTALWPF